MTISSNVSDFHAEDIAEFRGWLESSSVSRKSVKSTLYHYTDAAGLVGILRSRQLWHTSILHVNDPSEFTRGIRAFQSATNTHENSADISSHGRRLCGELNSRLHALLSGQLFYGVASLSKHQDELGQWRAYGDDGRGFSLGLSPGLFQNGASAAQSDGLLTCVAEAVYEDDREIEQRAMNRTREIICKCDGLLEKMDMLSIGDDEHRMDLGRLAADIVSDLVIQSLSFKDKAYSSEQEIRVVYANMKNNLSQKIGTRICDSRIVPYVAGPDNIVRDTIDEIWIGPNASGNAGDALESLLVSTGCFGVSVVKSKIPYVR